MPRAKQPKKQPYPMQSIKVAVQKQFVDRDAKHGAPELADPMAVMFLDCTIDRKGTTVRAIAEVILVSADVPEGGTERDYILALNWCSDPTCHPTQAEGDAFDLAVADCIRREMGSSYKTVQGINGDPVKGVVVHRE